MVLSALNSQVIARARAPASSGSRPGRVWAMCRTIEPDSNSTSSPSS